MATVQDEILDDFFTKLSTAKGIDEEQLKALRTLFKSTNKLKAEALAVIFSAQKTKDGAI